MKENIYAMNMDHCPDTDAVIDRMMCSGCPHYKGFEIQNAMQCIKCTYYSQFDESQTTK